MFELYQTKGGSRGSAAEVWIDKDLRLVKKFYKPTGITITGGPPYHQTMDEITALFNNEIYWSDRLKGDHTLEVYEYGRLKDGLGFYLLQEYVGPDLLYYYDDNKLRPDVKNPVEQIVDMFTFFKEKDVYKLNNAMCNLTNDNGRIRAFDFKYAVHRSPDKRQDEIYSINSWLSKIDSNLPHILLEYL